MNPSKDVLLNEISSLEKENHELTAAIRRIDDKELFETVKIYTSLYRKFMYRKIPFNYLETVFYSQKEVLLKHASGCFIEKFLDVAYDEVKNHGQQELVMHIPMYCSNVFITGHGVIFALSDPYRSITTKPMKGISEDAAMYCKGRMLIAKIVIPENHRAVNFFELRAYKLLKMTLTNIIGKEPPIDYNTIFTRFKDVTRGHEAIKVLDFIEDYYRKHNPFLVIRQSDTVLRIVTDEKKIGVWYEKDQLWFGEEYSKSLLFYNAVENIPQDGPVFFNADASYLFEDENLCCT